MSPPPVVGVLGGTFDPVHWGHVGLAEQVRARTGIERVLLLPSAVPPHKPAPRLTAARHRETMLRLAVAEREGLEVCTLELRTERVCYTIDSLRRLRRGRRPLEPVFVIGLDSLFELPSWRDWTELIREFDLIAADRIVDSPQAGDAELAPEVARALVELPAGRDGLAAWRAAGPGRGGRIFRLRMPPIPISSSQVRSHVAAGRSLDRLVPPEVARYIQDNGLYVQQEGSP